MDEEKLKRLCWFCSEEITEVNKSWEHIIPNCLGGRLRSNDLLCKNCNNELGHTLDDMLCQQIYLPTILGITRQRGPIPDRVRVSSDSGKAYLIDKELTPINEKLEKSISSDGEITFYVRSEEEARIILKSSKRSKLSKEKIEQKVKELNWEGHQIEKPVFFEQDIIQGESAFKAVYKIGINYFIYSGVEHRFIEHCIRSLTEPKAHNNFITYYYLDKKIREFEENEISNLLFLRANPKEGIAYCYIELFSVHCFLVILNYLYSGNEISRAYCHDPVQNQTIEKQVDLELTREEVLNLKFPPCELNQDAFNKRLDRVFKIAGIEASWREIKKS